MSRKKHPLDIKETERYEAMQTYNQFLPIKVSINKGMKLQSKRHAYIMIRFDLISLSRANILTTECKLYME